MASYDSKSDDNTNCGIFKKLTSESLVTQHESRRRSERNRKCRPALFCPDDYQGRKRTSSSVPSSHKGTPGRRRPHLSRHKHPSATSANRPYDVLPNGQPFQCSLCQSPYVCDPLSSKRGLRGKRSRHMPLPTQKTHPITGKLLLLCNACCFTLDKPRLKKCAVQVPQEVKDAYLAEAKKFASEVASLLQDSEAKRLYCPSYKKKPCECLQKYLRSQESGDVSLEKAQELLELYRQAKKLSTQKVYCLDELTKKYSHRKTIPCGSMGLGNGHKRSKHFEAYVLKQRLILKADLCEIATQRILCYSNNFLHKKLKLDERGSRLLQQRGKQALGRLQPFEKIGTESCCIDNCVKMVFPHRNLVEEWRRRALQGQRESRLVLAEMLTPAGGARSNCYKFINWVTGCSFNTICKVRDQMRRTKGVREPPKHGMYSYWQQKTCSRDSNKCKQPPSATTVCCSDIGARESIGDDSDNDNFDQISGAREDPSSTSPTTKEQQNQPQQAVPFRSPVLQLQSTHEQLVDQENVAALQSQLCQVQSVHHHLSATISTLQQQIAALQSGVQMPLVHISPLSAPGSSIGASHQNQESVLFHPPVPVSVPINQSSLCLNQAGAPASDPQTSDLHPKSSVVMFQRNSQFSTLPSNPGMVGFSSNQPIASVQAGHQFTSLQLNQQLASAVPFNNVTILQTTPQGELLPVPQNNCSSSQIRQQTSNTNPQHLSVVDSSLQANHPTTIFQPPVCVTAPQQYMGFQQQQQQQLQTLQLQPSQTMTQLSTAPLSFTAVLPYPQPAQNFQTHHALLSSVCLPPKQLPLALSKGHQQNCGLLTAQNCQSGLGIVQPYLLQCLPQQGAAVNLVQQSPSRGPQKCYTLPEQNPFLAITAEATEQLDQFNPQAVAVSVAQQSVVPINTTSFDHHHHQHPLLQPTISSHACFALPQTTGAQIGQSAILPESFGGRQVTFDPGNKEGGSVTAVSSMTAENSMTSMHSRYGLVSTANSGLHQTLVSNSQNMRVLTNSGHPQQHIQACRQSPNTFSHSAQADSTVQPPSYCEATRLIRSQSSVQHSSNVAVESSLSQNICIEQEHLQKVSRNTVVREKQSILGQSSLQNSTLTTGGAHHYNTVQLAQGSFQSINHFDFGSKKVDMNGQNITQSNALDSVCRDFSHLLPGSQLHQSQHGLMSQCSLTAVHNAPPNLVQSVWNQHQSLSSVQAASVSQISGSASQACPMVSPQSELCVRSSVHQAQLKNDQARVRNGSNPLLFGHSQSMAGTVQQDNQKRDFTVNASNITSVSTVPVFQQDYMANKAAAVYKETQIQAMSRGNSIVTTDNSMAGPGSGQAYQNAVAITYNPISVAVVTASSTSVVSHITQALPSMIKKPKVPGKDSAIVKEKIIQLPAPIMTVVPSYMPPVTVSATISTGGGQMAEKSLEPEKPLYTLLISNYCIPPASQKTSEVPAKRLLNSAELLQPVSGDCSSNLIILSKSNSTFTSQTLNPSQPASTLAAQKESDLETNDWKSKKKRTIVKRVKPTIKAAYSAKEKRTDDQFQTASAAKSSVPDMNTHVHGSIHQADSCAKPPVPSGFSIQIVSNIKPTSAAVGSPAIQICNTPSSQRLIPTVPSDTTNQLGPANVIASSSKTVAQETIKPALTVQPTQGASQVLEATQQLFLSGTCSSASLVHSQPLTVSRHLLIKQATTVATGVYREAAEHSHTVADSLPLAVCQAQTSAEVTGAHLSGSFDKLCVPVAPSLPVSIAPASTTQLQMVSPSTADATAVIGLKPIPVSHVTPTIFSPTSSPLQKTKRKLKIKDISPLADSIVPAKIVRRRGCAEISADPSQVSTSVLYQDVNRQPVIRLPFVSSSAAMVAQPQVHCTSSVRNLFLSVPVSTVSSRQAVLTSPSLILSKQNNKTLDIASPSSLSAAPKMLLLANDSAVLLTGLLTKGGNKAGVNCSANTGTGSAVVVGSSSIAALDSSMCRGSAPLGIVQNSSATAPLMTFMNQPIKHSVSAGTQSVILIPASAAPVVNSTPLIEEKAGVGSWDVKKTASALPLGNVAAYLNLKDVSPITAGHTLSVSKSASMNMCAASSCHSDMYSNTRCFGKLVSAAPALTVTAKTAALCRTATSTAVSSVPLLLVSPSLASSSPSLAPPSSCVASPLTSGQPVSAVAMPGTEVSVLQTFTAQCQAQPVSLPVSSASSGLQRPHQARPQPRKSLTVSEMLKMKKAREAAGGQFSATTLPSKTVVGHSSQNLAVGHVSLAENSKQSTPEHQQTTAKTGIVGCHVPPMHSHLAQAICSQSTDLDSINDLGRACAIPVTADTVNHLSMSSDSHNLVENNHPETNRDVESSALLQQISCVTAVQNPKIDQHSGPLVSAVSVVSYNESAPSRKTADPGSSDSLLGSTKTFLLHGQTPFAVLPVSSNSGHAILKTLPCALDSLQSSSTRYLQTMLDSSTKLPPMSVPLVITTSTSAAKQHPDHSVSLSTVPSLCVDKNVSMSVPAFITQQSGKRQAAFGQGTHLASTASAIAAAPIAAAPIAVAVGNLQSQSPLQPSPMVNVASSSAFAAARPLSVSSVLPSVNVSVSSFTSAPVTLQNMSASVQRECLPENAQQHAQSVVYLDVPMKVAPAASACRQTVCIVSPTNSQPVIEWMSQMGMPLNPKISQPERLLIKTVAGMGSAPLATSCTDVTIHKTNKLGGQPEAIIDSISMKEQKGHSAKVRSKQSDLVASKNNILTYLVANKSQSSGEYSVMSASSLEIHPSASYSSSCSDIGKPTLALAVPEISSILPVPASLDLPVTRQPKASGQAHVQSLVTKVAEHQNVKKANPVSSFLALALPGVSKQNKNPETVSSLGTNIVEIHGISEPDALSATLHASSRTDPLLFINSVRKKPPSGASHNAQADRPVRKKAKKQEKRVRAKKASPLKSPANARPGGTAVVPESDSAKILQSASSSQRPVADQKPGKPSAIMVEAQGHTVFHDQRQQQQSAPKPGLPADQHCNLSKQNVQHASDSSLQNCQSQSIEKNRNDLGFHQNSSYQGAASCKLALHNFQVEKEKAKTPQKVIDELVTKVLNSKQFVGSTDHNSGHKQISESTFKAQSMDSTCDQPTSSSGLQISAHHYQDRLSCNSSKRSPNVQASKAPLQQARHSNQTTTGIRSISHSMNPSHKLVDSTEIQSRQKISVTKWDDHSSLLKPLYVPSNSFAQTVSENCSSNSEERSRSEASTVLLTKKSRSDNSDSHVQSEQYQYKDFYPVGLFEKCCPKTGSFHTISHNANFTLSAFNKPVSDTNCQTEKSQLQNSGQQAVQTEAQIMQGFQTLPRQADHYNKISTFSRIETAFVQEQSSAKNCTATVKFDKPISQKEIAIAPMVIDARQDGPSILPIVTYHPSLPATSLAFHTVSDPCGYDALPHAVEKYSFGCGEEEINRKIKGKHLQGSAKGSIDAGQNLNISHHHLYQPLEKDKQLQMLMSIQEKEQDLETPGRERHISSESEGQQSAIADRHVSTLREKCRHLSVAVEKERQHADTNKKQILDVAEKERHGLSVAEIDIHKSSLKEIDYITKGHFASGKESELLHSRKVPNHILATPGKDQPQYTEIFDQSVREWEGHMEGSMQVLSDPKKAQSGRMERQHSKIQDREKQLYGTSETVQLMSGLRSRHNSDAFQRERCFSGIKERERHFSGTKERHISGNKERERQLSGTRDCHPGRERHFSGLRDLSFDRLLSSPAFPYLDSDASMFMTSTTRSRNSSGASSIEATIIDPSLLPFDYWQIISGNLQGLTTPVVETGTSQ